MVSAVDILGAACFASFPIVVGGSLIAPWPRIVDLRTWFLPVLPSMVPITVYGSRLGGTAGLLAGTGVSVLLLVAALVFARHFRLRRFYITGISPSELPEIVLVLQRSLSRTGLERRDNSVPRFSENIGFLVGPADPMLGITWLGFKESLTRQEFRDARVALRNGIKGRKRLASSALSLGMATFGVVSGFLYLQI